MRVVRELVMCHSEVMKTYEKARLNVLSGHFGHKLKMLVTMS